MSTRLVLISIVFISSACTHYGAPHRANTHRERASTTNTHISHDSDLPKGSNKIFLHSFVRYVELSERTRIAIKVLLLWSMVELCSIILGYFSHWYIHNDMHICLVRGLKRKKKSSLFFGVHCFLVFENICCFSIESTLFIISHAKMWKMFNVQNVQRYTQLIVSMSMRLYTEHKDFELLLYVCIWSPDHMMDGEWSMKYEGA